jgi:hypothetical protein
MPPRPVRNSRKHWQLLVRPSTRAAVESPRLHANTDVNGMVEETGSTDPAATQPDLLKEIEEIQQAMREAGCS